MITRRLAIVGAGTMGTGIAIAAAQCGVHVLLIDADPAAAERAKRRAGEVYTRRVVKHRMKQRERAAALSRFELGTGITDVTRADVIIEAVYEDHAVKAEVLVGISRQAQPQALIATNTGTLGIARLAAHVLRPERFLGLHFFAPAESNPAVEMVAGERTAAETSERAIAFLQLIRKVPLPCRDSPGFAINRFFFAYANEAARLLGEAAGSVTEIDRAAEEVFATPAGPLRVLNIVRPRQALVALRNLATLGPLYQPAPRLVELGESDGQFDTERRLLPLDAPRHEALMARFLGVVFLAVLQEIDEDVAEPAAIDAGARLALKFTRLPCALMDGLGRDAVEAAIAPLAARHGMHMPASIALVGRLLA